MKNDKIFLFRPIMKKNKKRLDSILQLENVLELLHHEIFIRRHTFLKFLLFLGLNFLRK